MARLARVILPNFSHHIVQRGNRRQDVFFNEEDYQYYLELLNDYILMASGTAVLEGMFVGRPMVAAGKLSVITVKIIRFFGMLNTAYYTLPNNLANEPLVTELIQEDVTVDKLVSSVETLFTLPSERRQYVLTKFAELHEALRLDASKTAADILTRRFL